MNKQELIALISERSMLSKRDADRALTTTLDAIKDALKSGDKISIAGFGIFDVTHHPARNGICPRTGKHLLLPPYNSVRFRAGKPLRQLCNESAKPNHR